MTLRDEILDQPDAVARLLDREAGRLDAFGRRVRDADPDLIVIAARGSSDHAALYAQYVFGIRLGLPVALATPSAITLYGGQPRYGRAVVIGISQSGQSPDIVAVVEAAARQGAPTLAITNDGGSPLAGAADSVIELLVDERAVAATLSYTTQLASIARLASAIEVADDPALAELDRIPEQMAAALGAEPEAASVAARIGSVDRAVALGRGFEYATAREWALKLQELTHVLVHPFSTADFEHGPVALVEPGFPVLAVEPDGPGHPERVAFLERLRDEHGANVVTISDDAAALGIGCGVGLPAGTPAWLGPLVSVVPCQLVALHLARLRGLDPDKPRTISKVTLTR